MATETETGQWARSEYLRISRHVARNAYRIAQNRRRRLNEGEQRLKEETKSDVIDLTQGTAFQRQLSIFDPRHYPYPILIAGCGSIGSFIALTITKMGLRNLTLIDNDNVELHNISNQFFLHESIGVSKVSALNHLLAITASERIRNRDEFTKTITKKITRNIALPPFPPIVFSCVDNMKGRKEIYRRALKNKTKLLIDTRMGGEIFEVYTIDMTSQKERSIYLKSLHSDEQSADTRCTERSIIYNVLAVSAIAVKQLTLLLKHEDYKRLVCGDLRNIIIK